MTRRILATWFLALLASTSAGQGQSETVPVPAPVPFPEHLKAFDQVESVLSADLIQVVEFDQGGSSFTVNWRERPPGSSVFSNWRENSFEVSITFRITDVTVREGGNEIYVAGIWDDGRGVIKRFNFVPRAGGILVRGLPTTVEPRGTPMAKHSAEQILNDGTWLEPTQASYGVPTRAQVLGDVVGVPRSIAVDPAGRYLIILTEASSELYLLDLMAAPMVLELLGNATTLPELAQVTNVYIRTLESGGHAVLLHDIFVMIADRPNDPRIALIDSDNNGVFESISSVGEGEPGLEAHGVGHHDTGMIWQTPGVGNW